VRRQIAYGAERGVPWGVSESAYNLRDRHLTYQYRAFGVPDLALKRGLGRDLVIAPYASALAVMVDPQRALDNLRARGEGALGPYGFRDALDYTRPDPGQRFAVVGNYMAHHVGMSAGRADQRAHRRRSWQERFHADPLVRRRSCSCTSASRAASCFQRAAGHPRRRGAARPGGREPGRTRVRRGPTRRGRTSRCWAAAVHGDGEPLRLGLQPLRGSRRHPLAADGTTDSTGQFCYVKDVTAGAPGPPRTSRCASRPTSTGRCWPPTG
jgi:cyclic beta-1,2-glucan synthetase